MYSILSYIAIICVCIVEQIAIALVSLQTIGIEEPAYDYCIWKL